MSKKNNLKLTWQANLLFELLPCQFTKKCKNCRKERHKTH